MKATCFARFTVLLSLFLAMAALSHAQVAGRITGLVTDQSGAVIPGASVRVSLTGSTAPVATVTTNNEGIFSIPGLQPVRYDVTVENPGFRTFVLRDVKVDPGQELNLNDIRLEVSAVAETIEVAASRQVVQTANAEVSNTITNSQFARLPQLNRSPLALISTQAGVGFTGRSNTTINGLRVTYNNVTIDGVNIQDNFIRTNALDFLPNLLLLDQIAEVSISTSNSTLATGGGATQVSFVTPSGTNSYRGSIYWFNRNNYFAANSWFNNRDRIARPALNQNQLGGSLGGKIIKDKLFFYTNYEAFRLIQRSSQNRTILTETARQGIFVYQDTNNNVRQVNILQVAGRTMDPFMKSLIDKLPPPSQINNFRVGDSSTTLLRNTAGYSFLARQNRTRDNVTGKIDYYATERTSFALTYLWNRDINDRPDLYNSFAQVPTVNNDADRHFVSAAWRWNPAPTVTNELRGGFNLAPSIFAATQEMPKFFVAGLVFSNPVDTFMPQGRYTNTFNLNDTANWVKGKHNLQFGYQGQYMRTNPYNYAGIIPTYTLGIGAGQQGLVAADLPGVRSQDLTAANNLLANLAGLQNSYSQTFNVKDRNSGFVAGVPDNRNYRFDMHGFFLQDTWKTTRRLTLTLGLRYDYFTVVDERDALAIAPVIQNNDILGTLYSNYTLDFIGKTVGRPFYNADRNNFAPNVGLAYDVFGTGKLALRAGYSIKYVNDNHIQSLRNNVNTNSGLAQTSQQLALSGTISNNLAPVIVPTYKVPRTAADNFALNRNHAAGLPNPGLVTPYVQQWNFSIQGEIKGGILEVRYVGNKTTQGFRAFDYNQVNIRASGFLDDFNRALNNGNLARAATGSFNPNYNPQIPGSQPLTVFPILGQAGQLNNAAVRGFIERGEVGELAAYYVRSNLQGPVNFYPNMLALATNIMANYSNANYNALQMDYTRRFAGGIQFQGNYTYGKVMSDAAGDGQTSFEAFLDFNNGKLERARTPFDVTHALKGNFYYELPFGRGKRFLTSNGIASRILGGWAVSGLMTWQSGTPFSVLSERGTLNRAARSTGQNGSTAVALVNKGELDKLFKLRMTPDGPYYIAASALNTDGRAVQADGLPPFNGQVFANPGPGVWGGLQRRMFSGPAWFNMDIGVIKTTPVTERLSAELRGEFINAFNTPTFDIRDQNINSVNFGRITGTITAPRRIQFGLYLRF